MGPGSSGSRTSSGRTVRPLSNVKISPLFNLPSKGPFGTPNFKHFSKLNAPGLGLHSQIYAITGWSSLFSLFLKFWSRKITYASYHSKCEALTEAVCSEFSKRHPRKSHFDCIQVLQLSTASEWQIFALHEKHRVICSVREEWCVERQHLEWSNLNRVNHQWNANVDEW